jgi:hypothetical protein
MRLKNYLNEVYMSKSLRKDLDKSYKKSKNKFFIQVDGFTEESAPTKKGAETKRQQWIKWYMQNNKVSRSKAEKAVVVVQESNLLNLTENRPYKPTKQEIKKAVTKAAKRVKAKVNQLDFIGAYDYDDLGIMYYFNVIDTKHPKYKSTLSEII